MPCTDHIDHLYGSADEAVYVVAKIASESNA